MDRYGGRSQAVSKRRFEFVCPHPGAPGSFAATCALPGPVILGSRVCPNLHRISRFVQGVLEPNFNFDLAPNPSKCETCLALNAFDLGHGRTRRALITLVESTQSCSAQSYRRALAFPSCCQCNPCSGVREIRRWPHLEGFRPPPCWPLARRRMAGGRHG